MLLGPSRPGYLDPEVLQAPGDPERLGDPQGPHPLPRLAGPLRHQVEGLHQLEEVQLHPGHHQELLVAPQPRGLTFPQDSAALKGHQLP